MSLRTEQRRLANEMDHCKKNDEMVNLLSKILKTLQNIEGRIQNLENKKFSSNVILEETNFPKSIKEPISSNDKEETPSFIPSISTDDMTIKAKDTAVSKTKKSRNVSGTIDKLKTVKQEPEND